MRGKKFVEKFEKNSLTNGTSLSIMIPVAEMCAHQSDPWEHSSAGRAHALQAWGHRFEPCCSHQNLALWCSRLARQPVTLEVDGSSPFWVAISSDISDIRYASVAQLVEQRIENPRVVGSIPTGGTMRGQ